MNHQDNDHTTIGFSSILVVFIMLTLSTFTVLTLVSSNADYKLSKTVATRNDSFLDASNAATATISKLDKDLNDTYSREHTISYASIAKLAPESSSIEDIGSGYTLSYLEPISNNQNIAITLYIPKKPIDSYYEIRSYQVVTAEPDTDIEDNTLNLLQ